MREHIRSVAAFAQLPVADVQDGWLALMEDCPANDYPEIEEFNDYFIETWLSEDARIPLDIWNVCNEGHKRTNNHVKVGILNLPDLLAETM